MFTLGLLSWFRFVDTFSFTWFILLGIVVSFVSYIVDKDYLNNISISEKSSYKESNIFEFWFITMLSFGFLFLISDPMPLFNLIKNYIILIGFLFIPCYVLGGVCWGIIKWKMFLLKIKNKYIILKDRFLEKENITSIADAECQNRFKKYLLNNFNSNNIETSPDGTIRIFPRASNYKSMISSWMVFWVQSLIFTIIYNSTIGMLENFKVVFERIRIRISKYLDAMSIDQFEKINKEIETKP